MRKFKTSIGTYAIAFAVLTTSIFGNSFVSCAENGTVGTNVNSVTSECGLGNIDLNETQRQWLEQNTKKIENINDLQNFYNDNGSTYLDNIKRGNKLSKDVDNTKNKYFPKIGNQGSIGSCASWAMTYLQASYTFNKARDLDGKDKKNVMSPMWTYNMTNQGGNNGTTLVDVVYVLSEIGAVSMEDVPTYTTTANKYQYGDLYARDGLWLKASNNKINNAYMVDLKTDEESTPITSPQDEDLTAIKMLLDSGEILSCSSYAYKWQTEQIKANDQVPGNNEHIGEQIITRNDGYAYGGHRIAIVGYDDDIWADINKNGIVEEGEKGAFKIANSWGEEWGNDGCIWFSYDSINPVSCVADTATINMSRARAVSLMDIVAMSAASEYDKSNTFAEFTLNTKYADTVQVDIKAIDKNGNEFNYGVTPFKSSGMYYSVGRFGFDGTTKATDGIFTIDLRNVVKDLTPEKLNGYKWEITFTDTSKDNAPLIVKNVKLLDTYNGVELGYENFKETSLDGNSVVVK